MLLEGEKARDDIKNTTGTEIYETVLSSSEFDINWVVRVSSDSNLRQLDTHLTFKFYTSGI